ncbi:MAG: hypothetical protein LBL56_05820 [Treponema sp.]|nr:hypothetical protein [Treponema sp.]
MAKSISPPAADSNGNSGILPPPFGRNPASLPFFAFRFLFCKNLGNPFTPASLPAFRYARHGEESPPHAWSAILSFKRMILQPQKPVKLGII